MATNTFETSFPPCPECGLIHPPDPSGKCPIVEAQKNKSNNNVTSTTTNDQQPQQTQPIISEVVSDTSNGNKIDFSDMIKSLIDIAMTQIKMKNISDVNEVNKIKQYVIIEVTKAFERYPHKQT